MDYKPSSIKAIAVDEFSDSALVAIGREDGSIELKTSLEKWCTLCRVAGRKDFNLRGLAWSQTERERGRLFGVSLRGFIFEVDLQALSRINVTDSYGGAAWCMAANPGRSSEIAVGCEDGSVRLFSYAEGRLGYRKALPNTGNRVLSLAYHPRQAQLFMGGSDGVIRCIDERSGRSILRMTGDLLRGATTMIWSLKVLSDSTVFSGDTRGRLQVWDGRSGTLMNNIHQHTADILAIAVSADENTVFASGVDSKVICVRRIAHHDTVDHHASAAVSGSSKSSSGIKKSRHEPVPTDSDWLFTNAMRPHTHDVYALAVCTATQYPPQPQAQDGRDGDLGGPPPSGRNKRARSRTNSTDGTTYIARRYHCLVSGGLDTKLCAYSVADFQRARPVWQLPIPARGLMSSSGDGTRVAVQHASHIDLWHLRFSDKTAAGVGETSSSANVSRAPCRLSLRLSMTGEAHVQCAALSSDGRFLATSSATATQVWALSGSDSGVISAEEVNVEHGLGDVHAMSLTFSASAGTTVQLAVATTEGEIRLVLISPKSLDEAVGNGHSTRDNEGEGEDSGSDTEDSDTSDGEEETLGSDGSENDDSDDSNDSEDDVAGEKTIQPPRYTAPYSSRLLHTFDHASLLGDRLPDLETGSATSAAARLVHAVSSMNFSKDGAMLAVSSIGKRFCLYDLDQRRLVWVAPELSSLITCVKFHPASPTVVVLLASNEFYSYDTDSLQLTSWSQENTALIPSTVKALPRPLEGLHQNPNPDSNPNPDPDPDPTLTLILIRILTLTPT